VIQLAAAVVIERESPVGGRPQIVTTDSALRITLVIDGRVLTVMEIKGSIEMATGVTLSVLSSVWVVQFAFL
jgi:hypothetical protein